MICTILTIVAIAASHSMEKARRPDAWAFGLGVVAVLPIAWRRIRPVPALWAVTVAQIAFDVRNYAGAGWLGVLIMLYTVAVRVDAPARLRHAGGVVAAATILAAFPSDTPAPDWGAFVFTLGILPSAFILGDNIRRRCERYADLAERAERAERERELLALRRVSEERTRIARELHDVVAHSLSVMVIQAAAARRQLTKNPGQATEALATIESQGRQAMNEMRRVLGVLRSDPENGVEWAPVPSLSDLPALVDADPDHRVTLTVHGTLDHLPAGVELAAYRVVQEALTNVRKHAGPDATTTITVDRLAGELIVDVIDHGRGASTLVHHPDGGLGLVGMRERVASCAGRLDAGPKPGGGWQVRAQFPLDGRTAGPEPHEGQP